MFLSWALLGERLSGRQWLVLIVIIAGIILLEWPPAPAPAPDVEKPTPS